MRFAKPFLLLIPGILVILSPRISAQDGEVRTDDARVRRAAQKGLEYLAARQQPNGSWRAKIMAKGVDPLGRQDEHVAAGAQITAEVDGGTRRRVQNEHGDRAADADRAGRYAETNEKQVFGCGRGDRDVVTRIDPRVRQDARLGDEGQHADIGRRAHADRAAGQRTGDRDVMEIVARAD